MAIKIKKSPPTAKEKEEEIKHSMSGGTESIDPDNQLAIISKLFKHAAKVEVNYESLKKEMEDYNVDLPENPDIINVSEMNEKYALAQSGFSRVSAIEMLAIDNYSRWSSILNRMEGYIDARRSEILLQDSVAEMKVRQQDAMVKREMKKDYKRLYAIKEKVNVAESFLNMVKVKKKDLNSIITNISRQVKVLSLDYDVSSKQV